MVEEEETLTGVNEIQSGIYVSTRGWRTPVRASPVDVRYLELEPAMHSLI